MICQYVVLFTVYSFFGWIFECTYCTFKTNRWENRGFLFGPIIPIYGFGAIAASIVFGLIPQVKTAGLNLWQIFLVCAVGSAILEYITSFLLEKIFHAVWRLDTDSRYSDTSGGQAGRLRERNQRPYGEFIPVD